jgi:3-oxoacyl-[acyl-carrier protein] reductase
LKTAFITGTARGIGRAVLEAFAENGYNGIAHARKASQEFEDHLAALAKRCGVTIEPVYFDMRDHAAMKACVGARKKAKIPIDVLVNNAGIAHSGLFQMTSADTIRDVFEVNLFAQMELTRLILKVMPATGAIVNVASIAGRAPRRGNCAYGVSKAALIAFTQALAAEFPNGPRVNAVAPGLTDTDMAAALQRQAGFALRESAAGRWADPREIAEAILFLASDRASFIQGQTLCVDGGGLRYEC